jgi:hypothetical protein
VPVWKTIPSKVNPSQQQAQDLLEQWQQFRTSGICADLWNIQESKEQLEHLANELSTILYCNPEDVILAQSCRAFEKELSRFKSKIYYDLLKGLKTK